MNEEKCQYHNMKLPCMVCLEDRRREKEYIKKQRQLAEEYHRNYLKNSIIKKA